MMSVLTGVCSQSYKCTEEGMINYVLREVGGSCCEEVIFLVALKNEVKCLKAEDKEEND